MITIGIDPAFRKAAFAVVIIDDAREVEGFMFRSFLDFMQWVEKKEWPGQLIIVGVENSNMQDCTYSMNGTKRAIAKQSRNVGANQAASQYTVDYCRHFFGRKYVFEISPRQKGKKWSQVQFQQVAKQEGHTVVGKFNQDKRDAYKIALQARKEYGFRAANIAR